MVPQVETASNVHLVQVNTLKGMAVKKYQLDNGAKLEQETPIGQNLQTLMNGATCSPCRPGQFLSVKKSNDAGFLSRFVSYLSDEVATCVSCHRDCAECSGPSATECTSCHEPLFLSMRGTCVPCCVTLDQGNELLRMRKGTNNNFTQDGALDANITPYQDGTNSLTDGANSLTDGASGSSTNCCKCYNSKGPCISFEHTRSILGVASVSEVKRHPAEESNLASRISNLDSTSVISASSVFIVILLVIGFLLIQTLTTMRKYGATSGFRSDGYSLVASDNTLYYDPEEFPFDQPSPKDQSLNPLPSSSDSLVVPPSRFNSGVRIDTKMERRCYVDEDSEEEEFKLFEKT